MNVRQPVKNTNSISRGGVWGWVVTLISTRTNNIYRGFLSKLFPSNASNSTSGPVKYPDIPQIRQARQMRQVDRSGEFRYGEELRLNEDGLWFLYPGVRRERARDRARAKRFNVVGWDRAGTSTRIVVIGGSPKTTHTYHNSFLERVCPKG